MNRIEKRAIGTSTARLDGPGKVTGTAPYAYEHRVAIRRTSSPQPQRLRAAGSGTSTRRQHGRFPVCLLCSLSSTHRG